MNSLLHLKTPSPPQAARDHRTGIIVECAIEVHRHLGPGLLESAYEECLCRELRLRDVEFKRQVALSLSPLPPFLESR